MQKGAKATTAARRGSAYVRFAYKWAWCLLAGLVALPSYASVISIQYQATELSPGANTWQYAYKVSGLNILNGDSFSVGFDGALYSNLQDPAPTPNADWLVFTFQPQPLFAVPGEYAALARTDAPSLADLFTVSFTWLGDAQRRPGAQTVTVYDPAFNVLALSETSPLSGPPPPNPVPLPGTAWPCGVGLASLLVHTKKNFPQTLNSTGPSSS